MVDITRRGFLKLFVVYTEVGEAKNLGDVRKVKVRNDMLF